MTQSVYFILCYPLYVEYTLILIHFTISGGITYHAALDINFGLEYLTLNPNKCQELHAILKGLQLVIIDEVSMVGADRLYDISRRLMEIMKVFKDPFGGVAIMLVGDLMQLPPVRAAPIFTKPKSDKNVTQWAAPKTNLWESNQVVVLKTNFR